jgi:hypothetical protein
MTRRTHEIGDVTLNVVNTETEGLYITLTQGADVIVLLVDQYREIAAIIDEV